MGHIEPHLTTVKGNLGHPCTWLTMECKFLDIVSSNKIFIPFQEGMVRTFIHEESSLFETLESEIGHS